MGYGVWTGKAVAKHCERVVVINPSGVDLAPIEIVEIPEATIFVHGSKRGYLVNGKFVDQRDFKKIIEPDTEGFYNLRPHKIYELRFPKVEIPMTATGFAYPRSTFVRLGLIKIQSAVWDSGYSGNATQSFYTTLPAKIHRDEAWIQLVFIDNKSVPEKGYQGHYHNETALKMPKNGKSL